MSGTNNDLKKKKQNSLNLVTNSRICSIFFTSIYYLTKPKLISQMPLAKLIFYRISKTKLNNSVLKEDFFSIYEMYYVMNSTKCHLFNQVS